MKDITSFNIAINDVRYSSNLYVASYNSSKNMVVCGMPLDSDSSLNTSLISKSYVEILKTHKDVENEYLVKSKFFFENLNKKNIWTRSGYSETEDFPKTINKDELSPQKDEISGLFSVGLDDFSRIRCHIVNNINQNLADSSNYVKNFEQFSFLKENLGKDIILHWNDPVLEYHLQDNNNLICKKIHSNLGDFLKNNKYKYNISLKAIIDSVDSFHNSNKELIKNLSPSAFENYVENSYVTNNALTKFIFNKTKNFESSSQN